MAEFPAHSHPPIVYPAAVTAASKAKPQATMFFEFLRGADAEAIFERHGFSIVK